MATKKNKVAEFRSQFDRADDMVRWIGQQINDWFNAPTSVVSLSLKLFHKFNLEPINVIPHKLAIDCLYITYNALGYRITVRELERKTEEIIGFKVRPEPKKWVEPFTDVICEMLNCELSDLPLRVA